MLDKLTYYNAMGYEVPPVSLLKTQVQIQGIRNSSNINIAVLDYITEYITSGITTGEIDRLIYDKTIRLDGTPAPLHYNGFPKSACLSINNIVCHGIPSNHIVLKDGDIVNVDVSTIYKGYYSIMFEILISVIILLFCFINLFSLMFTKIESFIIYYLTFVVITNLLIILKRTFKVIDTDMNIDDY